MAGLELVRVVWADAHAGNQEWSPLEELDDQDEYLVESIGFLLLETTGGKTKHLSVAQSVTPDGHVDHVIHIPEGMVRHMETLTAVVPHIIRSI